LWIVDKLNNRIIMNKVKRLSLLGVIVFVFAICLISGMSVVMAQGKINRKVAKEERLKWWIDARFGMMVHWGAYSQAGGIWHGVYEGGYSEWLKFRQIPNAEYDSLIRAFNQVDLQCMIHT
jgi:alpha-L-fucosidase